MPVDEANYLMTRDMHKRFLELRNTMIGEFDNVSQVFVPVSYCPGTVPFRILFVGMATEGWGEPELATIDGSAESSYGEIEERCATLGPRRRRFWQFVNSVVRSVCACQGIENEVVAKYVAWSNLVKLGVTPTGNPIPRMIEKQAALCIEQLRCEIKACKPTAVLLLTTNYAQTEIVEQVFGNINGGWMRANQANNLLSATRYDSDGPLVVWTNHPARRRGINPGYHGVARLMATRLIDLELNSQLRGMPTDRWLKLLDDHYGQWAA